MQQIIVLLIVLAAVVYLVWSWWPRRRKKNCGCDISCPMRGRPADSVKHGLPPRA